MSNNEVPTTPYAHLVREAGRLRESADVLVERAQDSVSDAQRDMEAATKKRALAAEYERAAALISGNAER